jgi:glycosyltransferase involved in cell wall biosynthesis
MINQNTKPFIASISVLVHTKNSAKTLAKTLSSVAWADEVIVIDMQSTDQTLSIAESHGVKVLQVADMGYVEPARNYAIKQAKYPWICIVDSDEVVPKNLAKHLIQLANNSAQSLPTADAYLIARKNFVFGGWLTSAGWWPDYQLRFFKKNIVTWSDKIHSQPKVDGEVEKLPLDPELALEHDNYPTISSFIQRLDKYTTHEVSSRKIDRESTQVGQNVHNNNKLSPNSMIASWSNELFRRLFANQGIDGGTRGIGVSFLQSMYELIVFLKTWEKNNHNSNINKLTKIDKSTNLAIRELSQFKSDLQYWLADWQVSHSTGFKQIWWRVRRYLKM